MADQYPQVVLLEGERLVETRPLGAEPLTVGRMPDNSLCVRDARVARFHFRVVRSGDSWIAQDLGSPSGITLNAQAVQTAKLVHGDEIGFGGHRLLFLSFADEARLNEAKNGKSRAAPRPGECPACWTTIARLRHEESLPEACPRCRSTFIPADPPPPVNFVRTRFRLAIACTIAEVPCLVREPMPGPPLPRVTGARTDGAAALIPDAWGALALRHPAPLSALALTADGALRSGDAGGELRTWDPDRGEELERFTAPGPVLALSPDGRFGLIDRGDQLIVHQMSDGVGQWSVDLGHARGNGTFDVEGRVTLHSAGRVVRFTRAGKEPMFEDRDKRDPVALATSRKGAHLLVVHSDIVRLREDGRLIAVLQPPGSLFYSGAVNADGTVCALGVRTASSVTAGGVVRSPAGPRLCVMLWHPLEARLRVVAEDLAGPPTVIALSDDASLLAWADAHGRVSLIDTRSTGGPREHALHARPVRSLVIDEARKRVFSAGLDGRLRSLSLADEPREQLYDAPGHAGGQPRLHLSGDGQRLASSALDGTLRVWDISSGAQVSKWNLPVSPGQRLSLAPTARRVAACDSQRVTAWVAATGQWLWDKLIDGPAAAAALAWSADGRALWVARGGFIIGLDASRGTQLTRTAISLSAMHEPLAFTAAGHLVARDGPDAIAIVDGTTGSVIARRRNPLEGRFLGLSADGMHVALWRTGHAVDVIDLREGGVWSLETPELVSAVAVAVGGRQVAVAFNYLGVAIFDTSAARMTSRWTPTRRLAPADQRLDALCFTPDGSQLIGATREGPLLRFRLP